MRRKEIFNKLNSSQKLPTPSRVALEVMRLCHSESASLSDIAAVIQTDPALSAELLKYANSAFMSTGIQVTTIQKAAVKLGVRTVVNLALGFSLLSHHREGRCQAFNYKEFWSMALSRAIAAKCLAIRGNEFDGEELFVCGLLAQIGKLTLASVFPQEYEKILLQQADPQIIEESEQTIFNISNGELSTELFIDWGLPTQYAVAAGCHELNQLSCSGNATTARISSLLHISNEIAKLCQMSYPPAEALTQVEKMVEEFGIDKSDFSSLFDTIISTWQEWGNLFKIPTKDCPLYHEIKAQENSQQAKEDVKKEKLIGVIADDDPITVLQLRKLLTGSGIEILAAADGEEALQLTLEHLPNLIITDWRMPKLSGLELCKILRNTTATQHTYIIMLTANEDEEQIVEAFNAGADDYVVKPFSTKVFEARIRGGERLIRYQKMLGRDREVIQEYAAKLSAANQKLHAMAMTDYLTGLPNRRYAMERLEESISEASRHQDKLSCIMIDLDHFKVINDTHGHHVGDKVLKEASVIFTNAARNYDTICRMGGEEFLIISVRNDLNDSKIFAERIRKNLENHLIKIDENSLSVTASFGVAQWNSNMKKGDDLIRKADNALYRAKYRGRNRVETSEENNSNGPE